MNNIQPHSTHPLTPPPGNYWIFNHEGIPFMAEPKETCQKRFGVLPGTRFNTALGITTILGSGEIYLDKTKSVAAVLFLKLDKEGKVYFVNAKEENLKSLIKSLPQSTADKKDEQINRVVISSAPSIVERLQKMADTKLGWDVQLKVGERVYQVHSWLLSQSSEYFRELFVHCFDKNQKDKLLILYLKNDQVFPIVLNYLYTGNIKLTNDNYLKVYVLADQLKLCELKIKCETFANAFAAKIPEF